MLKMLWGMVKRAVKQPRWEPPMVAVARAQNERWMAFLARPRPEWAHELIGRIELASNDGNQLPRWRQDDALIGHSGGGFWAAYASPCGEYHLCLTAEDDPLSGGCPEWVLIRNEADGSHVVCPLRWPEGCRLRELLAPVGEVLV